MQHMKKTTVTREPAARASRGEERTGKAGAAVGSGKSPRVALIHPPAISKRYMKTKFMPYGMAVLYSFLKEHSVDVIQYDFLMEYLFAARNDINYHDPEKTFSEQDFFSFLGGTGRHKGLAKFTEKYGDRLVRDAGIYAFSIVAYHQLWAALLLSAHIRRFNPEAVIVFGGAFITIKPPESFVKYGGADYWIKGSGEIPLLRLHELVQGNDEISKEQIPGLIYLNGKDIRRNPQATLPAEQERPPDFEGLPLDMYRYDHPLTGEQTLFLPYRVSKGCTSMCSFCTGRLVDKYDGKSVDKIVSEVTALARKYHTNNFQFADASINGNPRRLAELCDRLCSDFPEIRWYSYAKVNGFSADLLQKVKDAGCFALFWGVESAHQPTINLLGKRFKLSRMHELLDASETIGIKTYVHLIYNTPHESDGDVRSFIELVDRYIKSHMVVFLPNRFLLEPQSLMFEQPSRYGLKEIRKVETGVFEREQYTYEEIEGNDFNALEVRNEEHLKRLAFHLHWISFQNLRHRVHGRPSSLIPPKLLAFSALLAARSRMLERIHRAIVGWIESKTQSFSEQL